MTDEAFIRLENVTKVYPGTDEPAVAELNLAIPKGEILVLVGPSGCGKSTTLRLINRMIEPSSGRIIFDGEDVTTVNADELRRRIGYVIQQIGLFPHRTIAENIGTVPKLLGWDAARIDARVDELLEMVSMDPKIYRSRYPKELSGGQAQRVGVARALGADPEVLLMDEPFGAIDPITRDRLQNEFLRLQEELQKTIVFVTHDVDEAIKMGDRIAILREQSRIAQYDTPEAILAHPANAFVEDFLGSGAILKGLNLKRIRDLELSDVPDGDRPGVTRRSPGRHQQVSRRLGADARQGRKARSLARSCRPRPVRKPRRGRTARQSDGRTRRHPPGRAREDVAVGHRVCGLCRSTRQVHGWCAHRAPHRVPSGTAAGGA
jgi:osmoprotectant transport system ATP-binding protein